MAPTRTRQSPQRRLLTRRLGPGTDVSTRAPLVLKVIRRTGALAISYLRENAVMRIELTLDCTELDQAASFWQDALGYVVDGVIEGRYVSLSGHGPALTLQRVEERKSVKNRMHLDLLVDEVEEEVRRLEALGASRLTPLARQEFGQTWFVLADPEGNEFCVAHDPHRRSKPSNRCDLRRRWWDSSPRCEVAGPQGPN
jgi:predicted enzyme related to lactoylglutathione lyase